MVTHLALAKRSEIKSPDLSSLVDSDHNDEFGIPFFNESYDSEKNQGQYPLKANLGETALEIISTPRNVQINALDNCWWKDQGGEKSFAQTTQSVVQYMANTPTRPYPEGDDYALEVYGVPQDTPNTISFSSVRLCEENNEEGLIHLLGNSARKVDTSTELHKITTLQRMNYFAKTFNRASENEKEDLWSQFMACLFEQESLSGPSNRKTGIHVGGDSDGYTKVGLGQFGKIRSKSNIKQCYDGWNKRFAETPQCQRDFFKSNIGQDIASPGQAFNAFCSTHKFLESFYVQQYTNNPEYTHQANLTTTTDVDGDQVQVPISPEQRCVSPFSRSYMHFGPMRATTSENLDNIYACLVPDEIIKNASPIETKLAEQENNPAPQNQSAENSDKKEVVKPFDPYTPEQHQEMNKNVDDLVQLAVLGFGCDDYQERMQKLIDQNKLLPDYVGVQIKMTDAINDRCGRDQGCLKRMSTYIEPIIASITGQAEPGTNALAYAHEEARERAYRCRY